MAWHPKENTTHFDDTPIEGVFFLDGDLLAQSIRKDWTEGQKYPLIAFPSGLEFSLWETDSPEKHLVHLFGEMDLFLEDTCDNAFQHASKIAEQVGYAVHQVGEVQLEVIGHDRDEQLLITYDPLAQRIGDVELLKRRYEAPIHPAHILMPDELRKQFPPLYTTEEKGNETKIIMKLFLPGTHWTWYATEFDGEDLFFGLVEGFELELGYFRLSDLQELRSPMGLPVERDLHFESRTLNEILNQYHRRHHI